MQFHLHASIAWRENTLPCIPYYSYCRLASLQHIYEVKLSHCRPAQALRFPEVEASRFQNNEGGKVISPTYGTPLLESESTGGQKCGRKDFVNDTIGNRSRDLPASSAVPQTIASSRDPYHIYICNK